MLGQTFNLHLNGLWKMVWSVSGLKTHLALDQGFWKAHLALDQGFLNFEKFIYKINVIQLRLTQIGQISNIRW